MYIFIISSAVSVLGIKTGDLASMHRAQMSLRTLLYGSPVLCGAVAWLALVMVAILVRREVK
jgi:hypothetical protein